MKDHERLSMFRVRQQSSTTIAEHHVFSDNSFSLSKEHQGRLSSRNDFPTPSLLYIGDTCGLNRRDHMYV